MSHYRIDGLFTGNRGGLVGMVARAFAEQDARRSRELDSMLWCSRCEAPLSDARALLGVCGSCESGALLEAAAGEEVASEGQQVIHAARSERSLAMPFKSWAQRARMVRLEAAGEIEKGTVEKWDAETDFRHLPKRAARALPRQRKSNRRPPRPSVRRERQR
jgi:hypothetical protein